MGGRTTKVFAATPTVAGDGCKGVVAIVSAPQEVPSVKSNPFSCAPDRERDVASEGSLAPKGLLEEQHKDDGNPKDVHLAPVVLKSTPECAENAECLNLQNLLFLRSLCALW